MPDTPTFNSREAVDFVIIGSGAAGGILAKELSTAGFKTVVLEQGKYRKSNEFTHDEIKYFLNGELLGGGPRESGMTFRAAGDAEPLLNTATPVDPAMYARTVGGSSVIFSAHLWRMRPIDFNERSVLGEIEGPTSRIGQFPMKSWNRTTARLSGTWGYRVHRVTPNLHAPDHFRCRLYPSILPAP